MHGPQACKLAKLSLETVTRLKPHHIGLCLCGGASTTEVLSRDELSSELFVSKVVFQTTFPVPVAAVDTRSASTVRGELQETQAAAEVR